MDKKALRRRHIQNEFNAMLMAVQAGMLLFLVIGVIDSPILATLPLQIFGVELVIDIVRLFIGLIKRRKQKIQND